MKRTREASSPLYNSATAAMQQKLPVGVIVGESCLCMHIAMRD